LRKEIDWTVPMTIPGVGDDGKEVVQVDNPSRDKGKVFHIREMPASKGEKWRIRALMLAARSGIDVGQTMGMGTQGIAMLGISALMSAQYEEAEPLLEEMMQCVQIKPNPSDPSVMRPLIEDDIEEVETRLQLRSKWLELHLGFLIAGALSK
jgi:hypothetical protein